MWILLCLDILAIAALLVSNIYGGAVLLFTPGSDQAERLRQQMENASAADTYLNSASASCCSGSSRSPGSLGLDAPHGLAHAGTSNFARNGGTGSEESRWCQSWS